MIEWTGRVKGVISGVKTLPDGRTIEWHIKKPKGFINYHLHLGDSSFNIVTKSTIDECKLYAEMFL